MKVVLNKYNYIISYCSVGDLGNSVEIPNVENPLDYQFINGELVYNPIPFNKPDGVCMEYTGTEWVDVSSLDEQEKFIRQKIVDKTYELTKLQNAGFNNTCLECELESLRCRHLALSHSIALDLTYDEHDGGVN